MTRNDYNPVLRDVAAEPAIAALELCSVARGFEVADAILKEASLEVLFATPVHPGKYVVLFTGGIEDLASALRRGAAVAQGDLVDQLLIQQVHPQVLKTLRRRDGEVTGMIDALGIIETATVASCIRAADQALKRATVDLLDLRIANGLGGKSYVSLTGEVSDVRAAVQAGAGVAEAEGRLQRQVVIPQPHPDLVRHL